MRLPAFAAALLLAGAAAVAQSDPPRDANPLITEGDTRFNHGDVNGSIDSYSRALAADPRITAAYARRGRSYRTKGSFDRTM